MGKKSKRRTKPSAPSAFNMVVTPSKRYYDHLDELNAPGKQAERRRLGSSSGDPRRLNVEAEQLAVEARVMKKAKQNQGAFTMYSKCIELDPFNHEYFHHRSETLWNGKQPELARLDCQIGIDLCFPFEDYKDNECFSLLWCTLTRVCMEVREYTDAARFCDMGLSLVGDSLLFSRNVLNNYREHLTELLEEEHPNDFAQVTLRPVFSSRDKLQFVYTTKVLKPEFPNQPELLSVDLDISTPYLDIFNFIIPDKIREWSHGLEVLDKCSVFKVPESDYWVTAIPVRSEDDRGVIKSRLMCQCVGRFGIVLLKVDRGEEPPVEVDAEMYVGAVVKNAHKCESYYKKNKKLVEV
mmetsp:Transcript_10510/g.24512  ORF Transcript_10510/g.24512 Transcript_10510/m.24512 type:complete len:352 (+) Transcript_10510:110-1165(+)